MLARQMLVRLLDRQGSDGILSTRLIELSISSGRPGVSLKVGHPTDIEPSRFCGPGARAASRPPRSPRRRTNVLLAVAWLLSAAALMVWLSSCSRELTDHNWTQNPICLGPSDAQHFVVYLHGIDSRTPGEQERGNRAILERLAQEHSLRFALPRGQAACGDSICWGFELSPEQRRAAAATIVASARECFPSGARYGLVGFSNGGYLILNYLRVCELPSLLPDVVWSLAVGSGMMSGPLEPQPADLSGCGTATMLIGTADRYNFDPKHNYLHRLEAKHARITEVSFAGSHELSEQALGEQLARILGR